MPTPISQQKWVGPSGFGTEIGHDATGKLLWLSNEFVAQQRKELFQNFFHHQKAPDSLFYVMCRCSGCPRRNSIQIFIFSQNMRFLTQKQRKFKPILTSNQSKVMSSGSSIRILTPPDPSETVVKRILVFFFFKIMNAKILFFKRLTFLTK